MKPSRSLPDLISKLFKCYHRSNLEFNLYFYSKELAEYKEPDNLRWFQFLLIGNNIALCALVTAAILKSFYGQGFPLLLMPFISSVGIMFSLKLSEWIIKVRKQRRLIERHRKWTYHYMNALVDVGLIVDQVHRFKKLR